MTALTGRSFSVQVASDYVWKQLIVNLNKGRACFKLWTTCCWYVECLGVDFLLFHFDRMKPRKNAGSLKVTSRHRSASYFQESCQRRQRQPGVCVCLRAWARACMYVCVCVSVCVCTLLACITIGFLWKTDFCEKLTSLSIICILKAVGNIPVYVKFLSDWVHLVQLSA